MKILWLASWYPSKLFPFNGDFIKRQAEALSIYEDVHVLHIVRDTKGVLTRDILIEEISTDRLTETIIYYYSSKLFFDFVDKLFSEKRFRKVYKKSVYTYFKKNGKPDIVHVHVGMKAGVIALWIKRKWNIPYIITEHWAGFLKEANEKINDLPIYFRIGWKKVLRKAKMVVTVSNYLAKAIKERYGITKISIIPNVVNTNIFYSKRIDRSNSPQFIHISGLDPWKNPLTIIKAFQIILKKYPDAKFEIFGSLKKEIVQATLEMQLQNNIFFTAEVPQSVLAEHIIKSDALILYSSYETFGCVIIEANACGIPVIVSDIPIFHEIVKEEENGYFVKPNDSKALAEVMITIFENRSRFEGETIISNTRERYSYEVVGKKLSHLYKEQKILE